MDLFKPQRPTTSSKHIQQLKTWTAEILDLAEDVPISISQLQCHESGCLPIETVIVVMSQPRQTFKVHLAAAQISYDMVLQALTGVVDH